MELSLNQVDVTRLNLQPDETLIVTVRTDLDVSSGNLSLLKEAFKSIFPNNEVMVLAVQKDDSVELTSIAISDTVSCETGNFCSDCSCGKKEDFERSQNKGE